MCPSKKTLFSRLFIDSFSEVKSKDQFQISTADLITEKSGKITKDYTILNPPMGIGMFYN